MTVPEATPKLKTLQDGNPYGTRVNAGGYSWDYNYAVMVDRKERPLPEC